MIAREGYSNIAFVVVLGAVLCAIGLYLGHWSSYLLYGTAIFLTAFILFFFRDPDRTIPEGEHLLLAPADGKVVLVKDVEENTYIQGPARQISIFLSPADVHVNRVPASGIIEYIRYFPGVYLMAWDHRASEMNERADFGLMHDSGVPVFFRQITGFLARRIVYHIGEGDRVQAGERFGMMKFGSRMDILLPAHIDICVRKGDRTVAGETVMAHL